MAGPASKIKLKVNGATQRSFEYSIPWDSVGLTDTVFSSPSCVIDTVIDLQDGDVIKLTSEHGFSAGQDTLLSTVSMNEGYIVLEKIA